MALYLLLSSYSKYADLKVFSMELHKNINLKKRNKVGGYMMESFQKLPNGPGGKIIFLVIVSKVLLTSCESQVKLQ